MHRRTIGAPGLLASAFVIAACASRAPMSAASADGSVSMVRAPNDSIAGEYLTIVGGCNDCHTAGWAESNGNTPASERLARSVAPNVEPTTPYIWMVPRQPGQAGPSGQ